MTRTQMRWCAAACALALLGGASYLRAQSTTDAPSLAAIASELRLLRQAVEKSTETQTQIQALTAALSAQQSRLVQASNRADELRKKLQELTTQHADVNESIARNTAALASGALTDDVRSNVQTILKDQRGIEQKVAAQESDARTASIEADGAVQSELARWNDLMNRLDQLARR